MAETVQIFKVYANYRGCKVWHAEPDGCLVGWSSITLDRGLARRRRYDEIAKWLQKRSKLTAPAYAPAARERV